MLNYIRKFIPLNRCKHNHKVYISNKCPLCDTNSKRVFRYNTKLKVAKCYNCGLSFKEIKKLKDHLKYFKWLEDTICLNRRSSEKFEFVDNDLPF